MKCFIIVDELYDVFVEKFMVVMVVVEVIDLMFDDMVFGLVFFEVVVENL